MSYFGQNLARGWVEALKDRSLVSEALSISVTPTDRTDSHLEQIASFPILEFIVDEDARWYLDVETGRGSESDFFGHGRVYL